jgi:hypothetical protein
MNAFGHRRAVIDGLPTHFLHEPGAGPAPLPLVLTRPAADPLGRPQG